MEDQDECSELSTYVVMEEVTAFDHAVAERNKKCLVITEEFFKFFYQVLNSVHLQH